MAGTKIDRFSGIRPRVPDSLLASGEATVAQNCDFAYGELRNTKGGFLIGNMQNMPRSIYTDEGLTFYTWPGEVDAVRSPIAKDQYTRLYYTDGATMRVTNRTSTRVNGGLPASSYRVGVPRPSTAPVLTFSIPSIIDATRYTVSFRFHYEYAGVKYQDQAISPAVVSDNQVRFTPPGLDTASGTPEGAFPVLRMTSVSNVDASTAADLYTDNSSLENVGSLWTLAMAKDANADSYLVTLNTAVQEADKEARAYVYTYVNTYGEEGPPSAPAVVTTAVAQAQIQVSAQLDAVTDYAPIKEIRVYRTPSGSAIAEYFYVGSVQVVGAEISGITLTRFSFFDNVQGEKLNEALSSLTHFPPEAGLKGLMTLPNGILCAWKDNELHFSEPYKPWAWPPSYVKPLPNAIVSGIAHGSGALVTTTAQPYLVSGVSSDSMTTTRLNVDQAGVSKRAIAVVDGAVCYASHDGLVVIVGGTASLVQSQRFFTREVWRQRYGQHLTGMQFSVWDGRLIVFHGSGSFTPFMLRFDEADGTMTDLPNFTAQAAFVSQLSDQCYYAQGTAIYQFNGGGDQTAVWQSREMVLPRPLNFGAVHALVDGNWTLNFYADGVLRHTETLGTGEWTFRLPAGFKSARWKVRVAGVGRMRELSMAETSRELMTL